MANNMNHLLQPSRSMASGQCENCPFFSGKGPTGKDLGCWTWEKELACFGQLRLLVRRPKELLAVVFSPKGSALRGSGQSLPQEPESVQPACLQRPTRDWPGKLPVILENAAGTQATCQLLLLSKLGAVKGGKPIPLVHRNGNTCQNALEQSCQLCHEGPASCQSRITTQKPRFTSSSKAMALRNSRPSGTVSSCAAFLKPLGREPFETPRLRLPDVPSRILVPLWLLILIVLGVFVPPKAGSFEGKPKENERETTRSGVPYCDTYPQEGLVKAFALFARLFYVIVLVVLITLIPVVEIRLSRPAMPQVVACSRMKHPPGSRFGGQDVRLKGPGVHAVWVAMRRPHVPPATKATLQAGANATLQAGTPPVTS